MGHRDTLRCVAVSQTGHQIEVHFANLDTEFAGRCTSPGGHGNLTDLEAGEVHDAPDSDSRVRRRRRQHLEPRATHVMGHVAHQTPLISKYVVEATRSSVPNTTTVNRSMSTATSINITPIRTIPMERSALRHSRHGIEPPVLECK